MSRVCDLCGKKKQIGRQSRHRKGVAGKQWAKRAQKTVRVFKPNLQSVTINGKKMTLCTKCLKLMKKENKVLASANSQDKTEKKEVVSASA
ncbi:MAG: large ribosomal subunit protein bL28 [Microgenomates group bacterium]